MNESGPVNYDDAKISRALAASKLPDELWVTFERELQPMMSFRHATLFLFNNEASCLQNFFSCNSVNAAGPFRCRISFGDHPGYDTIVRQHFLYVDPLVLEFRPGSDRRELLPYLKEGVFEDIASVAIINLFRGCDLVGVWVALFDREKPLDHMDAERLCILTSLVTQATLVITGYEKSSKAKLEMEVLRELQEEFSRVTDTNILGNIHMKLQKLFDFTHTGVALVTDDGAHGKVYLRDSYSIIKSHPRYQELLTTSYPMIDGVFNKALLSNEPVIFNLEHQIVKGAMPCYMQLFWDNGVRTVIMAPLQVRSKRIGVWTICQLPHHQITAEQLQLIKTIAARLAIVVDNIRCNDVIKAKEVETDRLLKLSFALTKIRTKEDLHGVLQLHIGGLIDFREIRIVLLNGDGSFTHFLSFHSDGYSNSFASRQEEEARFRLHDDCFNRIMRTDDIVVFDLESMIRRPGIPEYIKSEYDSGIREKISIKIQGEFDIIGVVFINLSVKDSYSDHALQLIRAISYQLSIAINNIFSHQKIRQREFERDLLLSLSMNIAVIRSKDDLLRVINDDFKGILGFRHSFLARINPGGRTASAYLPDPDSASATHPCYQEYIIREWPLNDGILDRVYASPDPVVLDLFALNQQEKLPEYLLINLESGLTHLVMIRMFSDNRVFGFWAMLFDTPERIRAVGTNLIRGLAGQVSVALLNIIANEEITRREEEKTKLIELGKAIFSIRKREDFAKVLRSQLNILFRTKEYILFLYDKEADFHQPYIYSIREDLIREAGADVSVITGQAGNGLFSLFDTENEICTLEPAIPELYDIPDYILQICEMNGLPFLSGSPIYMGDERIGVLICWHDSRHLLKEQETLWRGVCGQIATAISNVAAAERISSQLNEINNYQSRLEEEKFYLQEEIGTTHNYSEIIGQSPGMQKVFQLISQVSGSDSTVLILGETGTGKELVARAIHNNSSRKNNLMVKVNCAAIPANLIESELFGHERGSFTGAMERRIGKFELAHNGTLFLDEIGEMPSDLQVKLLRALQEKEIERIGGRSTIKVDVRVISATNRDLLKEMEKGHFRSDLYYRLNIFPITLPALRERREDIPLLAAYFVDRFSKKAGKRVNTMSNRALQQLKQYNWPGNIREMEHLIERSILLTSGEFLKDFDLPVNKSPAGSPVSDQDNVLKTIDENEREHILRTLKFCGGRINGKTGAAEILGVPASTLQSKMKRLGIKRQHR